MNLFIWNTLKNRERLSFAIRRPYLKPFEPAILEGYMKGNNWPDILFRVSGVSEGSDFIVEGDLIDGLAVSDLYTLDNWHAVDDGLHKRVFESVKVMRDGQIVEIKTIVYVAGNSFSKIKLGARLI